MLALLLPILRPIGDHRKSVARPSQGRNRAKRKALDVEKGSQVHPAEDVPEISKYVSVGLNNTYRSLEAQARSHRDPTSVETLPSLDVVLVCRKALPEPACNSLPLLMASASSTTEGAEPLRLIPITEQAATSIAAALDLPRAAMLGIGEAAPGVKPLIQYVREAVSAIDLSESRKGPSMAQYLPLKVETAQVPVNKKQKATTARTKTAKEGL